ncbi:MAG: hypothetical protein U0Q16_15125 [Bryobacteraceae bacterium]
MNKALSVSLLLGVHTLVLIAQTAPSGPSYAWVRKAFIGTPLTGNGGPAIDAAIKNPRAIAYEPDGSLLILDQGNYQIRRAKPNGTIVGVHVLTAFCRDMKRGRDGTLYLSSPGKVFKILPGGETRTVAGNGQVGVSADGGQATSVPLTAEVWGLAVDDSSGTVYFVDGNRVRKAGADGVIGTVAGTAEPGLVPVPQSGLPVSNVRFRNPSGLALDAAGNLYVADIGNQYVWRLTRAGQVFRAAGTGSSTGNLSVPNPKSVLVDGNGTLFVGTSRIGGLYEVSSTGATRGILDGSATIGAFTIDGLALDPAGKLVFSAVDLQGVFRLEGSTVTRLAGRVRTTPLGTTLSATEALLNDPQDVAPDAEGNLLVRNGIQLTNILLGNVSIGAGNLFMRVTPDGKLRGLATSMNRSYTVQGDKFAEDEEPSRHTDALLLRDGKGKAHALYDKALYRLTELPDVAGPTQLADASFTQGDQGDGGPFNSIHLGVGKLASVAFDSAGNIYLADRVYHRLRKVSAATNIIDAFAGASGKPGFLGDSGPASSALFNFTVHTPMAMDAGDNLYIGDGGNLRIRRISAAGIVTTVAGNGQAGPVNEAVPATSSPCPEAVSIAFDASGSIYFAATDGQIYTLTGGRIRRLQVIDTVHDPEDPMRTAPANNPTSLRFDKDGDLMVIDTLSSVIWKLVRNAPASIAVTSGNIQTGNVGEALAEPVKFRVNGRAGLPVAGVPVAVEVASGPATVSPATLTTGADGVAGFTVRITGAGAVIIRVTTLGVPPVEVRATGAGSSKSLTVTPEALSFVGTTGESAATPPEPQIIAVGEAGVEFEVAAAVEGDVSWLAVEKVEGGVSVRVTEVASLPEGTYKGSVTVSAQGATPSRRVVPVELVMRSPSTVSESRRRGQVR